MKQIVNFLAISLITVSILGCKGRVFKTPTKSDNSQGSTPSPRENLFRNEIQQIPAPAGALRFGASMDSNDRFLVVGAPGEDEGNGAAYVYHRQGDSWALLQRISYDLGYGNDFDKPQFGFAVALNEDGLLAIGMPGADSKRDTTGVEYRFWDAGLANIYRFDGTVFQFEARVDNTYRSVVSASNAAMGSSLAWMDDVLFVGSPDEYIDSIDAPGFIRGYILENGIWTRRFVIADEEGYKFGKSIKVSGGHLLSDSYGKLYSFEIANLLSVPNGSQILFDQGFLVEESFNGIYSQGPDSSVIMVGNPSDVFFSSMTIRQYRFNSGGWSISTERSIGNDLGSEISVDSFEDQILLSTFRVNDIPEQFSHLQGFSLANGSFGGNISLELGRSPFTFGSPTVSRKIEAISDREVATATSYDGVTIYKFTPK